MKPFGNRLLHLSMVVLLVLVVILIIDKKRPIQVQTAGNPQEQFFVAAPFTEEGKQIKAKLTETEETVGDLQMADNESFKIEYLIANDDFMVTIKKSPWHDSKVLAEQWFWDQGFVGFDVCHLEVSFVPAVGLNDAGSSSDAVFTKCPVPDVDTGEQEATLEGNLY